jgi:hypothetical protein
VNDLDDRIIGAIGEPRRALAARRADTSDADRAALIGRLHLREDAAWLTELLIDIEDDELVRWQLVNALRRVL